jgi:hypothetical protein
MALAVFAVVAGYRGQPAGGRPAVRGCRAHGLPWWHFTQRLSVAARDELRARTGSLYATLEAEGGAMDRERLDELLTPSSPLIVNHPTRSDSTTAPPLAQVAAGA